MEPSVDRPDASAGRDEPQVTRASWVTLIAMTGSLSMVMLDQTVVSVALPTMTRDLPLSGSGAQWVVNGYVLAMAAAVALGGRLGSKLGPVTTFRIGVATFFTFSALCGLAPAGSMGQEWMVAARVGQGLGAALMMPVTASIVMAAFPERMRGRAMGTYVGISQIFLALGPLLGGASTEWLSWRVVFWINVPVGLAALYLVGRAAPANPKQPALRVSPLHTILLMAGVGGTVYALQESSSWGWSSAQTLGTLTAGVLVLATFVVLQLRDREPLVDVRLFAQRAFLGDTLVLFATQFGMLAMTLYSSLYIQNLLGYSPAKAGLASLSMIVPLMIGAQIAGRWYDRVGIRPSLLTGMVITTVGAAVWTLALPDIAYLSKVPGMVLVGFGLGLAFSPLNTDALGRVAPSSRPQASGIVQTVRQLGGTLGVAIIGSVILARENPHAVPADRVSDTAHAMANGFWIAVAVFAAGLLIAFLMVPRRSPVGG
jgi:EmrB/QacA subfamily drug resistance transporter